MATITNKHLKYKTKYLKLKQNLLSGGADVVGDNDWSITEEPGYDVDEKCNLCILPTDDNLEKGITLLKEHGFDKIGEGGFGIVMVNPKERNCAIKFLKDSDRCEELVHEYNISHQLFTNNPYNFGLTKPILFKKTDIIFEGKPINYCQFNQRIVEGPSTLIGDIIGTKRDVDGNEFYLLTTMFDEQFFEQELNLKDIQFYKEEMDDFSYIINIPKNNSNWEKLNTLKVEGLKSLIHLYINKEDFNVYEPDRGHIRGFTNLKKHNMLSIETLQEISFKLGLILSYIMLKRNISPNDVEVVLQKNKDYGLTPTIIDFNEVIITTDPDLLVKGMFNKNGKEIFPSETFYDTKNPNPLYNSFKSGFTDNLNDERLALAEIILDKYNTEVHK